MPKSGSSLVGVPFGFFYTVLSPKLLEPAKKAKMAFVAMAVVT